MYQSLYINFSIQLSYVIPSDIAKNLDVDSLNKNIQNEFDKNNIIRNDNEQENIKVDTILVHRSFRREMFEKVKRRFERSLSINKSETIEEMDEERLETLYHNLLSDRLDSLIAKREMSDLGSVHTKKAIKMI